MRHCKQNHKPLFVASLDLRKAFDSVSHNALFTALTEGGAHESYVSTIKDLYYAQFTTFSYKGKSDGVRVYVERGIKQGDPLSPFLFNLTLDPLLNSLNSSGLGVHLGGTSVAAMAYASDLILMASTYNELVRNLEVAQKHFQNVGLKLNPRKTQYSGWTYEAHARKWFDYTSSPTFKGGMEVMPKLCNEPVRYLEVDLFVNKPARVSVDLIGTQLGLVKNA